MDGDGRMRAMHRHPRAALAAALLGALSAGPAAAAAAPTEFHASAAGRFAELALACVHQEYPNKIAHVLAAD
jgi:hypothetical protein